jgi:hypothetical protein
MPLDRTAREERRARIDLMFDEYRAAKRRRLIRRAIKLWRKAEAHQRLVTLESQPERIH